MGKKRETQFSFELPSPQLGQPVAPVQATVPENKATVYSFTEKKGAKDQSEVARYFRDIIQLARHFK